MLKPRIAVIAGPTATILNSSPLVTSNLARRRYGLPLLTDDWETPLQFDILRPQRLAKPTTVYVEQFSAHPLEQDAAHLYAPPDGYVDQAGDFHQERHSDDDIPVYEVDLRPEDGLIPLPYMARNRDGAAWEGDCLDSEEDASHCRQPFYPDAARVFEEIDRLGLDEQGVGNQLWARAQFDFMRVLPSGGYTQGLRETERTDLGEGDIPREGLGQDFFPYRPPHLRREPTRDRLAEATNAVQSTLNRGGYRGVLWLEGSPFVEETIYWLSLLIDTTTPIVGCSSADWPHGTLAASGDRNIVDAVRYLCSSTWADESGCDQAGPVVIHGSQIFAARDVQKADARPGGYVATGGHGGIVGAMRLSGVPVLTYVPAWRHTQRSDVRLSELPYEVAGVGRSAAETIEPLTVRIRGEEGWLVSSAIPHVTVVKHARYSVTDLAKNLDSEVEVLARTDQNLAEGRLSGFVVEGSAPYGTASHTLDAALLRATYCGMPIVRVGRGNAEGFVPHDRVKLGIAGSNLTATKARLLLMACLLRFGSLPAAANPERPTPEEIRAVQKSLVRYQAVFDTH